MLVCPMSKMTSGGLTSPSRKNAKLAVFMRRIVYGQTLLEIFKELSYFNKFKRHKTKQVDGTRPNSFLLSTKLVTFKNHTMNLILNFICNHNFYFWGRIVSIAMETLVSLKCSNFKMRQMLWWIRIFLGEIIHLDKILSYFIWYYSYKRIKSDSAGTVNNYKISLDS